MERISRKERTASLVHMQGEMSMHQRVWRLFARTRALASTIFVATLVLLLNGCLSSTPSNFPVIELPSTTQSPASTSMPSPSSQPSGSGQSSGQGQQSGMPSPPSPAPSTSTSPPLPRPPSASLPGADQSIDFPSLPSLPSPDDGSADSDMPGMPSGGQEQGEDGEEGEGEGGPDSGMDMPESGPLETGGPVETGDPEDEQASESEESADGELPAGSLLPGASEDGGDGGWEISNQLPVPGATVAGGDLSTGSALPGEMDMGEGEIGENPQDTRLKEVLDGIDGAILTERGDDIARANERAVAAGGPLDLEDPESDASGDSSETEDPGNDSVASEAEPEDSAMQPNLPPTIRAVVDTPDARDEDVLARQLREAAIAEEDPELKEGLLEDYETYMDGLK